MTSSTIIIKNSCKEAAGAFIIKEEATVVNEGVVWFNEQLEKIVKECRREYNMKIEFVNVVK